MQITLDIQKGKNGQYSIWLVDDCGGSGIAVDGTKDDVCENLMPYLQDYIDTFLNNFDINGNELHVGDRVRWYDPECEENHDRVFEIVYIGGEVLTIADEFGDAEVYADELEKID